MPQPEEIFTALQAGDAGRLATLLESDPALAGSRNENGDSPILVAAYAGRKELAEIILRSGVEVSLFEAAALGLADRVRAELARDPSLARAFSHDGWTALHLAAFFGHAESAVLLLDGGADVNLRSRSERFGRSNTPLHAAAANQQVAVAELLIARGADVNAKDGSGFTPLALAANSRNDMMVLVLLEHGAQAV